MFLLVFTLLALSLKNCWRDSQMLTLMGTTIFLSFLNSIFTEKSKYEDILFRDCETRW